MHIIWNDATAKRMIDVNLDSQQIGSPNDTDSPSDFPSPNPFNGNATRRVISNALTETFEIVFQDNPTGSGYSIQLHFDANCQITASN
jgi:hypothetical protein